MSYHKKKKQNPNKSKRIFIITAVVVAVVAVTVGAVYYFITQNASKQTAQQKTTKTPIEQADDIANKAQGQAILGKTDEAFKLYDDEIAKTTNKKQQAWLLVNKTTTALNSQKLDDALRFAQQAEALDQVYSSSLAVAQAAEAKGDKKLAAEYYAVTAQRYEKESKDQPFFEADLAKFKAKAEELSR